MDIKITVELIELDERVAYTILTLTGDQIQSIRLGQWIEQTVSRLCKRATQRLEEGDKRCAP